MLVTPKRRRGNRVSVARMPNIGPLMGPTGRPLRPLLVLLGSEGPWQVEALHGVHKSYGGVLRTDSPPDAGQHEQWLDVLLTVLADTDVVMLWLDGGPVREWPMVGMLLGQTHARLVCGVDPAASWARGGAVRFMRERVNRPCHDTLESTIAAARQAALLMRRS